MPWHTFRKEPDHGLLTPIWRTPDPRTSVTTSNARLSHLAAQAPGGLHHPGAVEHHTLSRRMAGKWQTTTRRQCDGWFYRQHLAFHWRRHCLVLPAPGLHGHVAAGHAALARTRYYLSGAFPDWLDTLGRAHGQRRSRL